MHQHFPRLIFPKTVALVSAHAEHEGRVAVLSSCHFSKTMGYFLNLDTTMKPQYLFFPREQQEAEMLETEVY